MTQQTQSSHLDLNGLLNPTARVLHDYVAKQLPPDQEYAFEQTNHEDRVETDLPQGCDTNANRYFWIPEKLQEIADWREGRRTEGVPTLFVRSDNHPKISSIRFDQNRGGCVFNPATSMVLMYMPIEKYRAVRTVQYDRFHKGMGKAPVLSQGLQASKGAEGIPLQPTKIAEGGSHGEVTIPAGTSMTAQHIALASPESKGKDN